MVFCFLVFWSSVPVQSIVWEGSSPKWPVVAFIDAATAQSLRSVERSDLLTQTSRWFLEINRRFTVVYSYKRHYRLKECWKQDRNMQTKTKINTRATRPRSKRSLPDYKTKRSEPVLSVRDKNVWNNSVNYQKLVANEVFKDRNNKIAVTLKTTALRPRPRVRNQNQ